MVSDQRTINVAFVADYKAVLPLAVAIDGLTRHLPSTVFARVYLLGPGLPTRLTRKLCRHVGKRQNARLILLRPADSALIRVHGLPGVAHVPPISYWRLLLPRLLLDVPRLLYLDADVVINRDVSVLLEEPLENFPLAAVPDPGMPRVGGPECLGYAADELSDPDAPAFNAGVMVMNLEQWRKDELAEKAIAFCRRHADRLRWADQDGLNFALAGRWQPLEQHWNVPISLRMHDPSDPDRDLSRLEEYLAKPDFTRPAIFHLYGGHKPWNSGPRHTLRPAWLVELRASGFLRGSRYMAWRVMSEVRCYIACIAKRISRREAQ